MESVGPQIRLNLESCPKINIVLMKTKNSYFLGKFLDKNAIFYQLRTDHLISWGESWEFSWQQVIFSFLFAV